MTGNAEAWVAGGKKLLCVELVRQDEIGGSIDRAGDIKRGSGARQDQTLGFGLCRASSWLYLMHLLTESGKSMYDGRTSSLFRPASATPNRNLLKEGNLLSQGAPAIASTTCNMAHRQGSAVARLAD